MQKKVIIHIGIGKTGTSSIQKMMLENYDILVKNKVLYPKTGMRQNGAHHNIAVLRQNEMNNDIKKLYNEAIAEYESNNCHMMILSSENFTYCRKDYIKKMAEIFKDWKVEIVFYVRNQKELVFSSFLQEIKAKPIDDISFDNYFSRTKSAFKFNNRVQFWEEYFGEENINVRIYDHPNVKKNVCLDFAKICNIDSYIDTNKSYYENESIISEFVLLTNLVNKLDISLEEKTNLKDEIIHLSSVFKKSTKKVELTIFKEEEFQDFYYNDNMEFAKKYIDEKDIHYLTGLNR